MKPFIINPSE